LAATEQFIWWSNGYAGEFKNMGDLTAARTKITGAANEKRALAIARGAVMRRTDRTVSHRSAAW
jgi:hypothetical protein